MRSRESSATENFSTKIAHGFYDAEVNNGGHHQYFWNSRGYFVDLVEKGLDYYRAKEQLAIFREAMSRDDPSPEKESTEPASSPPVEFSWEAIERVARRLGKELLKVSQARFKTADGATRFVGLASKTHLRHGGSGYWYGFKPSQKAFLEAGSDSWLALEGERERNLLLIPFRVVETLLPRLGVTPGVGSTARHVSIAVRGS